MTTPPVNKQFPVLIENFGTRENSRIEYASNDSEVNFPETNENEYAYYAGMKAFFSGDNKAYQQTIFNQIDLDSSGTIDEVEMEKIVELKKAMKEESTKYEEQINQRKKTSQNIRNGSIAAAAVIGASLAFSCGAGCVVLPALIGDMLLSAAVGGALGCIPGIIGSCAYDAITMPTYESKKDNEEVNEFLEKVDNHPYAQGHIDQFYAS